MKVSTTVGVTAEATVTVLKTMLIGGLVLHGLIFCWVPGNEGAFRDKQRENAMKTETS